MLKALKRNEKGLTLIELLAVLVIVGIIAAIAIPAIGKTIEKAQDKADVSSENIVKEAAIRYLIDHSTDATPVTSVTYKTLVDDGYLNNKIKFNNDGQEIDLSVTPDNGTFIVTLVRSVDATSEQPA